MDELELAWAAGFYDGEGHAREVGAGYISLRVNQVDRRPLDRFVAAVGEGKVLGPYPRKQENHSPCHVWQIQGAKAVVVLRKIWPYLSEPKREQIKRLDCVGVERAVAA